MDLLNQYNELFSGLNQKAKRYAHAKSAYNFIYHLEEMKNVSDTQFERADEILQGYLEEVRKSKFHINSNKSVILYSDYIAPLGELFEEIGFKKKMSIKHALFIALHCDLLCWLFFFKYPYPVFISIILFKYLLFEREHSGSQKVFGFFY